MASANSQCRLCGSFVLANRVMNIFGKASLQLKLASKVTTLLELDISNAVETGLPPYVCQSCKHRLLSIDKILQDLIEFRQQAKNTLLSLESGVRLSKRPKATSCEEVSPDTSRSRPPAKLSRKRLTYDGKGLKTSKLLILFKIPDSQRDLSHQGKMINNLNHSKI